MRRRLKVIVNPQILGMQRRLDDFTKFINELNGLGVWINNGIEYDDEDIELTEKIKGLTELFGEGITFNKTDNDI